MRSEKLEWKKKKKKKGEMWENPIQSSFFFIQWPKMEKKKKKRKE